MAVSRINEAGLNINQYGNRNLIINGAMQVAQRGTSVTGKNTTGYYTVDRFDTYAANMNSNTFAQSQSTDNPSGFAKSLRFDSETSNGAASNTSFYCRQLFEGQDLQRLNYGTSDAQPITISFFVKSNLVGDFTLSLYRHDGGRNVGKAYTINNADTWEYKQITIVGDNTTVSDDDNLVSMQVAWFLSMGSSSKTGTFTDGQWQAYSFADYTAPNQVDFFSSSSNYWQITGVQVEVGDTATDFEHRTFADELQRCQRYYVKFKATSNYSYYGSGVSDTATSARIFKSFPVEMNHVPVLEQSANNTWNIYPPVQAFSANATINNASVWGSAINCTVASGLQPGYCTHCTANNTTDAFFAFESEL